MMTGNNKKDKRFSNLLSSIEKGKVLPGRKFLVQLRDKSAEEFLTCSEESKKHLQAETISTWRIIMNSKITKFATAAVILVAILVGMKHFGGSIDGSSTAWADVLGQIYSARAVTYKQSIETKGYTLTSNEMLMEPGLMRSELLQGDILIWDFSTGTKLHLMTQLKQASIERRIGKRQPTKIHNRLKWLQRLHEEDTEFVGEEEVDGVMANVFTCEVPFEKTTVWVDPETNLPVKVKMEMVPNTDENVITPRMNLSARDFGFEIKTFTNEDGQTVTTGGTFRTITITSSRGSGKGIQDEMTLTYHDFVWDSEIDEALFSLVPPEGYTVKEKTIDVSKQARKDDSLVYGLRFWAEMSEGTFPDEIHYLGDPDKLKPMLIAKFDKDGDPEKELDVAMDEVHKIIKGLYFAQEKRVDGSWGYAGQGIQLGDADAIICWWFDEETEGYTAIFGDLSIGEVTEDQLPIQPDKEVF